MRTSKLKPLLASALLAALPGALLAQAGSAPVEKRELIYCADRMTPDEREAYRAGMRAARTPAEKEALRAAHRAEMQGRAVRQGAADACEPAGRQWRGGPAK